MPSLEQTSRDQFERILSIGRRTLRYTWLVAAISIAGAAISVVFALTRAHGYKSETTLLYREMISQSVLEGRDVVNSARSLSTRYREIVLSRTMLRQLVEEMELFPEVIEDEGIVGAVEEMRQRVDFTDRGGGTFRVSFIGDSPEQAEKVTARMADLLIQRDNEIRREQAQVTNDFLRSEKDRAEDELKKREKKLAQFLAEHPEFAEETQPGKTAQGASIRAAQKKGQDTVRPGDPRLNALQRQRRRIEARLDQPNKPTKTPAQIEAESRVKDARKEVEAAKERLRNRLSSYTERHPDVIAAKSDLASAQQRLRRAEASVPSSSGKPVDVDALREELREVENEIAARRSSLRDDRQKREQPETEEQNWVVALETDFARLMRDVEEARDRVDTLDTRLFTASIKASSEFASSSQLTIIDEAFEPAHPAGRSRKLIAAAGTMLFGGLAVGLAFGLALIDDRIYNRRDLEQLGIGSVTVVVPKAPKRQNKRG